MLLRKTRLNRALKKVHAQDPDDFYDLIPEYQSALDRYDALPSEAKDGSVYEDFKVLGLVPDLDD